MARKLESEAELRRRGIIDPRADQYAAHAARPLKDHIEDWHAFLLGKDDTQQHADTARARVAKLVSLAKADRLTDLSLARVQAALAAVRYEGLALRTVHHYARM